jgi:uncharacterized phosphosugar-binding protein
VGASVFAAITATSGDFTTAEIGTLSGALINVQSVSGASIVATEPNDIIEGRTLSGGTIRALEPSGIVRARTISGAQIYTLTGIILNDTDGSGCSALHIKNGVLSAQTHACP